MSQRLFAYVDETGDRGNSAKSSPIFGMAAVLVDARGAQGLRSAVETLRSDFGTPEDRVLSWKEDLGGRNQHDRRKRAAEVLAGVESIRVCYVYVRKSELASGTYRDDKDRFYNYVAHKTYKSILWCARSWGGADVELHTRFGHVRHHNHTATKRYIEREVAKDPKVPHSIERGLRWVSADQYLESQAADLFGGFLKAATWPTGPFGYTEPAYLKTVWGQIHTNDNGCVVPLGLMSMPRNDIVRGEPWFDCSCDRCTSSVR